MLRESLFKRFSKKKYDVGGNNTTDPNPAPIVLPGERSLKTNPNNPNQLEFNNLSGQNRQDIAWGNASQEPNIQRPKSVYDEDFYVIPEYNIPTEEQKFSKSDELTKPQEAVTPEKTFFQKAVDYTKDNWQGLGMNALAGASSYLNFKDDKRRETQLNQDIQQRQTKPVEDYNYMYGRTSSGGTRNQGIIMAKNGAQIQSRYNTPQNFLNNVEIEGGEYIVLPDGSSEVAKGPAHSQNYNVGGNSFSGINTALPNNTLVFSNSMKPGDFKRMSDQEKMAKVGAYLQEGGKINDLDLSSMFKYGGKKDENKTFAQIAKRYDTTYEEKILNNPFSKPEDRQAALLNKKKKDAVKAQLFRDQQFMNGQSNGEPQEAPMMANGGINNPGFKALPGYVQAKIMSNMEDGGKYYSYTKDGKEYKTKVKESDIKSKDKATNVGDYYLEDGVVKRVTGKRSGLPGYTGKDLGSAFAGNQDIANQYAYLEQQFTNPETRAALAQNIRAAAKNKEYYTGKSGKTSSAYGKLGNVDEMSDQELADAFLKMNKRNLALQAHGYDVKAMQDAPDAGGRTNKTIREASKKIGIPLNEDIGAIGLEQAAYLGYRDLLGQRDAGKLPESVAKNVQSFSIGQRGAQDEPGVISENQQITPIDAVYTNTSAGQYGASNVDPIYDTEAVQGTYEETPETSTFTLDTPRQGEYKRMPYDLMQSVPGAYGLAQAQEVFPYAIPEVDAPYIKPQTLTVDPQLQAMRNASISAMRAGADPNAVFASMAEQEANIAGQKSNWDAQAQERADQTNFQADMQAKMANAQLFNQGYNDLYATAKGNQSVAKQNAITGLLGSRAQYNADENVKEFYYNNFVPSFDFDPNQPGFKMTTTRDPNTGAVVYNKPLSSMSSTTQTYTPETTNTKTKEQTTQPSAKKGGKMAVGYYEDGGVVYEFMFNFDPKSVEKNGKNKKR